MVLPDWFIYWPIVHIGVCLAFVAWMLWEAGHAPADPWDDGLTLAAGSGGPVVEIQRAENGWFASSVPSVPGAFGQGRTRESARLDALAAADELSKAAPLGIESAQSSERER